MFDTSGPPSKGFIATLHAGYWGFHVTQVPPDKMSSFKKATFMQVNVELTLSLQDRETFLDSLKGERSILPDKVVRDKLRGASPLRHFFVMFLVKGAERRGQWITGAQKDLTLRWLRIY